MRDTRWICGLAAAGFLALAGTALAKKPPAVCDATGVASAKAEVDGTCPCTGKSDGLGGAVPWKNHGQYVSCVAKASKAAAANAGVAKRCLKDVVPCAANSTCGKSDDVACITTSGVCLNDPIPGDLTKEGTCDNDIAVACDTDADCSQPICSVMDPADCIAAGGSAAAGTCCTQ